MALGKARHFGKLDRGSASQGPNWHEMSIDPGLAGADILKESRARALMDAARGLVIPLSVEATSGNGTSARNAGEGCLFFGFRPSKRHLNPHVCGVGVPFRWFSHARARGKTCSCRCAACSEGQLFSFTPYICHIIYSLHVRGHSSKPIGFGFCARTAVSGGYI